MLCLLSTYWQSYKTTTKNNQIHKFQNQIFPSYSRVWNKCSTMFINLKQNKTEVLFFSHFTLCCLSNEFFLGLLWARATGAKINSIDSTNIMSKDHFLYKSPITYKTYTQGCVIFKPSVPLYIEKFDHISSGKGDNFTVQN